MSEYTREYWDKAAVTSPYDRVRTGWTAEDFDKRTDETLTSRIEFKPDDVVLDYGCGPGYACKLVAPWVRRYVGLDYSEPMLVLARERNRIGEFVECDGHSIPFPDGVFDVVFSELCFQHCARLTTLGILEEVRRVLKPAGRALLQLPTMFYGPSVGFTAEEVTALGWRVDEQTKHYLYAVLPA